MINWGVIGLGNMAQKFASSITETKNSKLTGIASLNKKKIKIIPRNIQYYRQQCL